MFLKITNEITLYEKIAFADIVEHLYHTKIPEIKEASMDKCLPRIVYKNKKIYLLNEEDDDNAIKTDTEN